MAKTDAAKKTTLSVQSPFIKDSDVVRVRASVDRPMLIIIIILLCFGTVMVFSASYAYALAETGDSYYYIKKQFIFLLMGGAVMVGVITIPLNHIKKLTPLFYTISALLLALVPVFGLAQGKAVRWLSIGSFTIQPSELMKPALVMMLALFIQNHQEQINDHRHLWSASKYGIFLPGVYVIIACGLVVLENHFSGTIIMFLIGMIVIFASGALVRWFLFAGAGFGVGVLTLIMFTDYARERIDIWLHPENYDSLDETWQTIQGLNAVGSGGLLGLGLGNSKQKNLFVSQPQNDFIFSIICEELGFIGALCVIALFIAFMIRGIHIARKAPDTYSSLVVVGITGHVVVQAILNIAVVTNSMPNTGISLPFFSYGGSSLIVMMAEMGVLLALSRYSYQQK